MAQIDAVVGSSLPQFLETSVLFAKTYVSIQAHNFEGVHDEFNFEKDIQQVRNHVAAAMLLNTKHLVSKGYMKLTVRLQICMLDFYPIMTKEQF